MFRLIVALSVLCLASASLNETTTKKYGDRIVGGRTTTIFEHPYQVSLQIYGSHFCGASILSSHWCLTAAHCLKNPINNGQINQLSIRIGSSNWKSGGSVKNIDAAINHPNYNPLTYEYDVGLIRTTQAIVPSSAVKPVILITTPYPSGIPVVVSGWGRMHENANDLPTDLQVVQLTSMDRKDCTGPQSIYEESRITDSMTCAVGYDKDSCQGDSGGPICSNGNTRCQMGVVSWGVGCAKPNAPGVYAALSNPVIIQFILSYAPDAEVATKCPTSMTAMS